MEDHHVEREEETHQVQAGVHFLRLGRAAVSVM
jgi:hypothetical protein